MAVLNRRTYDNWERSNIMFNLVFKYESTHPDSPNTLESESVKRILYFSGTAFKLRIKHITQNHNSQSEFMLWFNSTYPVK